MKQLIEELKWRGLLHQHTGGLAELDSKDIVAYVGFDPTSDSLHIGNLAPIMLMSHISRAGGRAFGLVGGATGMIGDPSGKKSERKFLDEETLDHNFECIREQVEKLLPGHTWGDTYLPFYVVNNYDWYGNMSIIEFLRTVGKHMSVNVMMAKDSVRNRIKPANEGEIVDGISFTEFTYQLIQAEDFRHLFSEHGCNLQMGGSDQWGNITSGIELIRKANDGVAHGLTCPLITKADGSKFGKSEKGNIWLDAEKTTPFEFFQYWINSSDEDAEKFVKIFTFDSKEEIDTLITKHKENPAKRLLQQHLATNVTRMVHGDDGVAIAKTTTGMLFQGQLNLEYLTAMSIEVFDMTFKPVPRTIIEKTVFENSTSIFDLLSATTNFAIFTSKGDAKRMISNNGVSINCEKINTTYDVDKVELLHDRYVVVQKGKKNFHLIEVE